MEPTAPTDPELLTAWVQHRDEAAFHALVSRYTGLVHSAAKRACGGDSLAAEASQLTFILLARKAKSLTNRSSLGGWLYLTAAGEAKNLLRSSTRETRKRSALLSAMAIHTPDAPDSSWQEIQPFLNDALAALSANDREAILLRFYRSLSVREIAATLGIANDAAQKRLDRATERLREKLTRRGVTTTASLSAVMLAGFATDANAAVISTSVLSAKAIAAASTATSTSILATLLAMKATSYIAPAVLILLSGTWLVSQRLKISALDHRSELLQSSLARHTSGSSAPTHNATAKAPKLSSKIDAKTLTREYAQGVGSSVTELRFYVKYKPIFEGMTSEELGSIMKDLYALGASNQDARALARMIMPLLLREHFPCAFEHFLPQLEGSPGDDVSDGFKKWSGKDLAAAGRWLDQQIAAGKLDSKSLDGPNPMHVMLESQLFLAVCRT